MDQFTRRWLSLEFRDRFHNAFGDDFQRFFGSIMNLRCPGDFTQTRPWGRLGDNKCDGYLPSRRKFYQCYAPYKLEKSETLQKLQEDFEGALPYQKDYFDVWIFVHNARDGRIPTWLSLKLDDLRREHSGIGIETLGYWELHGEALQLEQGKLVDLFGPLPSLQDMLAIEFKDIRPLLEYIAHKDTSQVADPKPVSPQKLKYNQLSQEVEYFLKLGMIKAADVRTYLDQTIDKELGTRVASAFREKYDQLKQEGLEPDNIYFQLRVFTQGSFTQEVRTEAAVLAVLSYLFEECDIFETP